MYLIELYVSSCEEPTGLSSLGDALLRQVAIHPTGEYICSVPLRLPVPDKDEPRMSIHFRSDEKRAARQLCIDPCTCIL